MKLIICLFTLILFKLDCCVNAQTNHFNVSKQEYLDIKINGVSIYEIEYSARYLTSDMLTSWFGNGVVEKSELGYLMSYGSNWVYVSIVINEVMSRISRLEIVDTTWVLKVKGHNIMIGDTFESICNKLNQQPILVKNKDDNNYSLGVFHDQTDYSAISLEFDAGNKKLIKIVYFLIP